MRRLSVAFLFLLGLAVPGLSQFFPYPAARVVRGTGAPSGSLCASSGDVGKVYIRSDTGATTGSLYVCANTGVATYAWQLSNAGSGSVTTVGWTGGIVSIANPTTTPAFTIAGTSGGVVCFTGSSTWASGAALGAAALVVGGGAGACPTTPSATTTLDASGNLSTPGTGAFGVGGSTAGGVQFTQGTANAAATSTILLQAPASVTAYNIKFPGAAATGLPYWSNSSNTVTEAINTNFTSSSTTITAGASGILDMSAASVTAGLKLPSASGAAPTADGFLAVDTTAHTLKWGSNGSSRTGTYTVASGTKALNNTAVSSATCSTEQTDTATGIATTDAVSFTFNGDPSGVTGYVPLTAGGLTIYAYPKANAVGFRVCNFTAGSITPGNISINYIAVR